jgi:glycosyltransferase involved in cell wall biosynthesis
LATRILFLAWAPFFSGAERALLLTVKHLDPARYTPSVAVGTDGETLVQLRAAGIDAHHIPLAPLERRRPLAGLRSVWAVRQLARRRGAALIHANDAPSYQPGGLAGRLLGIPAITHIRFPNRAAGFRWFLRPPPARVLFVSDAIRRDATGICPSLFEGRSEVLHDGVALPALVTPTARQALRRELQLDSDTPVVALTGQVSEIKGIWEFVEAARLVAARGTRAVFAVLGDDLKTGGAVRRAMEQRVAELGLSGHFRFLGFRPNAPALIPAFDLVAVPSHVEPLGNATLEAMAAGIPVVGSRVGGIPEMVADGETGLLVPPRDAMALAEALCRLINDPVLRQSYGAAARSRAESHFSLSLHADRLQATYDRLLGGDSSRER